MLLFQEMFVSPVNVVVVSAHPPAVEHAHLVLPQYCEPEGVFTNG